MQAVTPDYFDALYKRSDDPWRIAGNWYEQRKRSLVAAMLPRARYRHGFEPGCGSGELTLELASRCDRLLVGDLSASAIALAQERWQLADVWRRADCTAQFRRMRVPQDWPLAMEAMFDLIILSEFAYYLDAASLQALPALIGASLASDGVLLACHWKHDFSQRACATAAVHAVLGTVAGVVHSARYEDSDVLLDVWCRDTRSVATLEGLT